MKKIDSILKNFDVKLFLKDVKSTKEGSDLTEDRITLIPDDDEHHSYLELKKVINSFLLDGTFFRKIKEFKLIYLGDIDFPEIEGEISIICFYATIDKRYHLMIFEHWLETHYFNNAVEYNYIKNFKSKPSIKNIEKTIIENKMRFRLLTNIDTGENLILGKDYWINTNKYY